MTRNWTMERRRRRRRTTPIVLLLPISLLLFNFAISVAAVHLLDLSYLFRTKASSLAAAIRQGYDNETATAREDEETAATCTLDLDLTSSLLEQKNYTQVMEAALLSSATSSNSISTTTYILKLTARRNQWTSQDGTAILQQILNKLSENDLDDEEQADDGDRTIGETPITTTTTVSTEATDGPSSAVKDSQDSTKQMAVNGNDGNFTVTAPAEVGTTTTTTSMEEAATEDSIPVTTTSMLTTLSSPPPPPSKKPAFVLQSLDLGWNYLGGSSSSSSNKSLKSFHKALQKLVSHPRCPTTLTLELCGLSPAACRSIAKGIVERYPSSSSSSSVTNGNDKDEKIENAAAAVPPLSLNLACNEAIGDGGVAALAAAIRTVASQQYRNRKSKHNREKEQSSSVEEEETKEDEDDHDATVLERLDLSSCSISDAGAEALAVALEKHPLCVKHLDLSNNDITNEGASTLARALLERNANNRCGKILTLNLSNNKGIADRGAKALAEAVQEGCIENMILRSCHLHADGVAYFGKAMRILAERGSDDKTRIRHFSIDLSGNPLGILRKKSKTGNKYSASALKSKATETTSAYMNLIGKTVQKGLKDLGLAEGGGNGLDTLESDDEEEERMGKTDEEDDDSKNKCGGISLAEAFIADDDQADPKNSLMADDAALHIQLGLRHCSLDTRASEALAAVLQESRKQRLSMNLTFDMRMNDVLEEEIVAALHGEYGYDDKITEMAESYLDAVEVIREAQQRALEAARIARARAKMEAEREEAWGTPVGVHATGDDWDDDYEREWDSDAEYDPPGDDEDDYWS